jgi:hypothetical protein
VAGLLTSLSVLLFLTSPPRSTPSATLGLQIVLNLSTARNAICAPSNFFEDAVSGADASLLAHRNSNASTLMTLRGTTSPMETK